MNEEFPVSASHKLALITSLPFVHTARRYYRLDGLVSSLDWSRRRGNALVLVCREEGQTVLSRGSKSRNKVSVGEPAEGSLTKDNGANHWQTISWSRCDGPNPGARDQVARMGCGEKNAISFGGTERALGSRSRNRLRRLKFRRARPRPGL